MMLYPNGVLPTGMHNAKAPVCAAPSHPRTISALRSLTGALLFLVALALSVPSALHAQVQNGTITGTVTDPASSVVPGADVTLTQTATNLVLHGQTNTEGLYIFPQMLPGQYMIAVEKDGFRKTVSTLTLTVGQTARLDVTLPVGSKTETVTIEAEDATTLDTQTSNLDYTVQSQQVNDLPLNGRNPYGLAILSPGINPGGNFGVGVTVTRGAVVAAATNNFESNGGVGGSNEVLLDGVSIVVCCQGQPAVTPSTEVVSQFKVVTSNAPAEYGRTSGAVLNIATKSGTNHLHGEGYDFLRNDQLDAANFFTKHNGVYPYPGKTDFRAPHRANQFGVFVGGPVYLPRVYNGKDKTFFTFGYEGIRNFSPTTGTTTVPTALMRQGIFTEAPAVVYDPNSSNSGSTARNPIAAATCNGTPYAAGYCIPQSTWNSVAKGMLALYPAPNLSGTTNNYSYVENLTSHDDQFNFRIDHNFSDKQRAFVRGTRSKNDYTNYDLFNTASGSAGWQQHLKAYLFAVGDVWTLSPSTLLQFSYGFARQTNYQVGNSMYQYDASKYGFSSTLTGEQQITGLPVISITSEVTPMFSTSFNKWAHYTHSLNASALSQKGKHSIALGYNGRLILENQEGLSAPTGSLGYDSTFTGGPTPNSSLPGGQSMFDGWAAFLLGYPSSGSLVRQKTVAFNQWVTDLYAQDDWRITNKLTLNMGARWDVESGFKERHNNWADFDPTVTNPISSAVNFSILGGAQFLGAGSNPTRTSETIYHGLAPRLGLSYQFMPKIVLRGGYGILYLPISERGYGDPDIGFTQSTNIPTTATGFTPAVTSDNPLPSGVALPAGASAGAGVSVGSSISGFQYKNPLSYQQQWNLGIERSLDRGMSATINYVGGHGVDLPMNLRPNDLQPAYWGPPGSSSQVAYLQAQVSNPFYGASGVAAGSALANATVQRAQLLSAFPQYTSGTISSIQNGSVGISYFDKGSVTYNALQATWLVNRPGGLTGSVTYIFDLTNGFLNSTGNPSYQNYYFLHQYEHSTLATDIRHRIAGTATYPLPFGKGKPYANSLPTWANEVIGGWTVTSIIDVYSGFPLGLGVSGTPAFAGSRPVYTGSATLTSGGVHNRLGGVGQTQAYFNTSGFRLPQSFELGTVPRSAAALRGPISFDDNASVIKNFPIHEDLLLEFRCEAFNVLNKVDFGLPNTTYGSSSFGRITSQANLPRNIQLSAKLHF
jgi:hypothetical protein